MCCNDVEFLFLRCNGYFRSRIQMGESQCHVEFFIYFVLMSVALYQSKYM